MSLHAILSPEARARLIAQRRNSTVSSVFISFLAVILVGLILAFILIPGILIETPGIIVYKGDPLEVDPPQPKELNTAIKRTPSAASPNAARVLATLNESPTSIPVPDVLPPDPSSVFGDGDDYGDGNGNGPGDGGGPFTTIPKDPGKRCSKEDRLNRLAETGGTPECEDAVIQALRHLQSTQNKDGSWDNQHQVAMTGLALLAYLGHCETPYSVEFGETVTSALVYLVNVSTKNNGKLATNIGSKHWCYEHAIATYAISEAYTMCRPLGFRLPNLEQSVQDSVQWIINNQHNSGGWEYSYEENSPRGGDLSITAWQLQALKAGKATGLDFRNYRTCISKALDYVRECQSSNGAYGYVRNSGGKLSLTGAGALCLQQHKGSSESSARKGVKFLEQESQLAYQAGPCNLYEHYYSSQAMINAGGKAWKKYNNLFRDELLGAQNKDGSWPAPGGKGHAGYSGSVTYNTALSTLMLEVYYRFLPATGAMTK